MKRNLFKSIIDAFKTQDTFQEKAAKHKLDKSNKENDAKPDIRFLWWTVYFSPNDHWFYRIVVVVLLLGATVAIVYFGKK